MQYELYEYITGTLLLKLTKKWHLLCC